MLYISSLSLGVTVTFSYFSSIVNCDETIPSGGLSMYKLHLYKIIFKYKRKTQFVSQRYISN